MVPGSLLGLYRNNHDAHRFLWGIEQPKTREVRRLPSRLRVTSTTYIATSTHPNAECYSKLEEPYTSLMPPFRNISKPDINLASLDYHLSLISKSTILSKTVGRDGVIKAPCRSCSSQGALVAHLVAPHAGPRGVPI